MLRVAAARSLAQGSMQHDTARSPPARRCRSRCSPPARPHLRHARRHKEALLASLLELDVDEGPDVDSDAHALLRFLGARRARARRRCRRHGGELLRPVWRPARQPKRPRLSLAARLPLRGSQRARATQFVQSDLLTAARGWPPRRGVCSAVHDSDRCQYSPARLRETCRALAAPRPGARCLGPGGVVSCANTVPRACLK